MKKKSILSYVDKRQGIGADMSGNVQQFATARNGHRKNKGKKDQQTYVFIKKRQLRSIKGADR